MQLTLVLKVAKKRKRVVLGKMFRVVLLVALLLSHVPITPFSDEHVPFEYCSIKCKQKRILFFLAHLRVVILKSEVEISKNI